MSAGGWPHGDPNAVVHEILAQPAFRDLHAAAAEADTSALERFFQWLGGLAGPIFNRLFEGAGDAASGNLLILVLYAVAALAFVFLAAALAELLLGRRVLRLRSGRSQAPAEAATASPESLQREASAAADGGDFGRAIALLFRAALLVLDRAAILAFDAARTPGEYRRLVRREAVPAAPPFDELAARFVYATFGTQAASRADFDVANGAYAAFVPRTAAP